MISAMLEAAMRYAISGPVVKIDVRDIHVLVLARGQRLLEPFPFERQFDLPARRPACFVKHSPDTGRTHRYDVGVRHHEGEPRIVFPRMSAPKSRASHSQRSRGQLAPGAGRRRGKRRRTSARASGKP